MATFQQEFAKAIRPLRDELERLHERLAESRAFHQFWERAWCPAIELLETADTIIIRAEVPGIPPEDIDISVRGDTVLLRGEKRADPREKGTVSHRSELDYGPFERSIKLPAAVKVDAIEASAKDGVLSLVLPKHEDEKARKIKVGGVS